MADANPLFSTPALLTEANDCATFDSGEGILDDWLRFRALDNLRNAASRTYVICPVSSKAVVGFYALSMGQILGHQVLGSMRRKMPLHIPSVILGRLAIDLKWQGKGLGAALLADAVRRCIKASNEVAARLLIVHAISPAAEAFYLHHGFTRLPTDTPTLALDLKRFEALLKF